MFLIFRKNAIASAAIIPLDGGEIRHVRARRLKPGDPVFVGDGISQRFQGELSGSGSEVVIGETPPEICEEPIRILFTSVPSGKRWDWLIQKAVEAGVTTIQPVIYRRSERYRHTIDREERIIHEAAAQSRRFTLPEMKHPVENPVDALRKLPGDTWKILLDTQDAPPLPDVISDPRKDLAFIVGPEGGWEPSETASFKSAGAHPASLGRNILRVETACIVALGYASMIPKK